MATGCSQDSYYSRELVTLGGSGEYGAAHQELAHDAAESEDVHFLGVVLHPEHKFWRPVPSRRHILGVRASAVFVVLGQAEISQLEQQVRVDRIQVAEI